MGLSSPAKGRDEAVAATFYGATLMVLGFLINVMWRYAAHGHRLLDPELTPDKVRRIGRHFSSAHSATPSRRW